jgi:predicted ATPase
MNLHGIEVFEYAGLKCQYIPLGNRVQILAGRNNVGKTALLQAIAAFSGSVRYKAYTESDSMKLAYIFDSDGSPQELQFLTNNGNQTVPRAGTYRVETTFAPNSLNGGIELIQVRPDGYTEWINLAVRRDHFLDRQFYRESNGRFFVHGTQQGHAKPAHLAAPLTSFLKTASYIDPHRKIEHDRKAQEHLELPTNGAMLGQFLQSLQGKDHKTFAKIERAFLSCFREYSKVLIPLTGENISVSLADAKSDKDIPIRHCGTGVEQILILIACILGAKSERMFLLDEPQDFLHPFLERRLMEIIEQSPHRFLIATHSATMINSVSPNQITLIEQPGQDFHEYSKPEEMRQSILRTLGYRNSDLMFFEGAVFVEGLSDTELLPLLLSKADPTSIKQLKDACFCDLGGTRDYATFDDLREDLVIQEKLVKSLHRSKLPHIYLFDGDKKMSAERIKQTQPAGEQLNFTFLDRSELENYLLDAKAISLAMNQEMEERNANQTVSEQQIIECISTALGATPKSNKKLHAQLFKLDAKGKDPIKTVQGSRVLDWIYSQYTMTYNKRRSGKLILQFLTLENDAIQELRAVLRTVVSTLQMPS